ncbi:MAG: M3 family oligoendopeptidase [Bdellovibrionales bacterium]|nr:M3 family oligoendopeptidase [Bdellovibrionales bacterium]
MSNSAFVGPAWDLESEYPSLDSPRFRSDLEELTRSRDALQNLTSGLKVPDGGAPESEWVEGVSVVQKACAIRQRTDILMRNLASYVNMLLSVDSGDAAASKMDSVLEVMGASLTQAWNPADLWITLAPGSALESYMQDSRAAEERFVIERRRLLRDQKLSLAEENLVSSLQVTGLNAWGTLYDRIAGGLKCSIQTQEGLKVMGAASAQELTASAQEPVRRAALEGITQAWVAYRDPCAAILNAIAGWRLEVYRRRSHTRPVGFMDCPLYSARIQPETLEAMMGVAMREGRALGHRAYAAMARAIGKKRLDPWDRMAPAPALPGGRAPEPRTYSDAIGLISGCADRVAPEMGEFFRMMASKRWIEGRVMPRKLPGAFCTSFARTREPRVFMTYQGTPSNVRTPAHELGHAFHTWAMRDLPIAQCYYPMTLAETASIFMETLLNDAARSSGDETLAWGGLWEESHNAAAFLVNIPMRYTFEKEFYEKRASGELSADEFEELNGRHHREHYGDSLSGPDPIFWQSKLHFYISGISFYNFPYTFGYLFALGVYAQREKLGPKFFTAYRDLLRDTGRMVPEDVARKHLGVDLTKPDFWRDSVRIAEKSVAALERAVNERFA